MTTPAPVELPRTWRPLGVRLASVFFFVLLVVVCAAAWFGFDDATRAKFTPFQKSTIVGLGLMIGGAFWALSRSKVVADDNGLLIVNGFRARRFAWPQVVSLSLNPGAPWATVDLNDGHTVSAMGLQGSDGQRAHLAVREIRSLIERSLPRDPA